MCPIIASIIPQPKRPFTYKKLPRKPTKTIPVKIGCDYSITRWCAEGFFGNFFFSRKNFPILTAKSLKKTDNNTQTIIIKGLMRMIGPLNDHRLVLSGKMPLRAGCKMFKTPLKGNSKTIATL